MKNFIKTISFLLIPACIVATGCGKKEEETKMKFYEKPYRIGVSVNGSVVSDANENADDIYSALEIAKRKRAEIGGEYDAISVTLAEGEYFLDKPIEITREYADSSSLPLVIEGAGRDKVTLSGGKTFKGGWQIYDATKGIYKKSLDKMSAFRQLYTEDGACSRSRYPDDTKNLDSDYLQLSWDEKNHKVGVPSYITDDISISSIKGAELHFVQEWTQSVGHISTNEPEEKDGKIWFDFGEKWFNDILFSRSSPSRNPEANRCWFEDSLAFLTSENEWFFDDEENTLYYKPRNGVEINSVSFSIPQIENIISVTGEAQGEAPEGIVIKDLTIANSTWVYANENDYLDGQAGIYASYDKENAKMTEFSNRAPACVYTQYAKDICLYDCAIKNTGAYGIDFGVGTKNARVIGCTVENCATSAINVGYYGEKYRAGKLYPDNFVTAAPYGYAPSTETEITENVKIENNVIKHVGISFKGGSTGIVGGYLRNIDIIHNEIEDVSYSGVAIGWGWESPLQINCNVNISYNKITNVMNHLPYDGAPIYLLGKQKATLEGSQIIGNYIEVENGLGGIYFDNSSSCYTLKDNVIKGEGRLGIIDLHDWNYFLRNIKISNTYVSTNGKLYFHAYAQDYGNEKMVEYYKTHTPPTPESRGVYVDEPIKAYNSGKWSKEAEQIIKSAGITTSK